MTPWIRALAFLPLAAGVRIRRVEGSMIARLKDAGANTAERGILLQRDGLIRGFVFERLSRAGVLQDARNDRYYLDEAAYARFRGRRRRRALLLFALLLTGILIMFVRGDFSS